MGLDHQQVMDTIACSLPDLMAVDAATVRLLDAQTGQFVMWAAHGLSAEYLSRFNIDTEETMEMIRSGYPVAKNDVNVDSEITCDDQELIPSESVKTRSYLGPSSFQEGIYWECSLLFDPDTQLLFFTEKTRMSFFRWATSLEKRSGNLPNPPHQLEKGFSPKGWEKNPGWGIFYLERERVAHG